MTCLVLAPQVSIQFENNRPLVHRILHFSQEYETTCIQIDHDIAKEYKINTELDHGVIVPLYFISEQYSDFKLVHISIGFLPYEELYAFGKAIQDAVKENMEDVVVIASGDLSHRLTEEAPAGYKPSAKEFDRVLVDMLKNGQVEEIVSLDKQLVEDAGECGLRPITIMLGVLDGYEFEPQILSYEGPFGVGYCVGSFELKNKIHEREILKSIIENKYMIIDELDELGNQYVALARETVETYITTGKVPRTPLNLNNELLTKRAGVFVSIKKNNELRGCIGTIEPAFENVAQEIINNTISASTRDFRFKPIEEDELNQLTYSVDLLNAPEPIKSMEELDVKRYGVIVLSGYKKGLLLPNLEGVDTVEQQVEIALRKAGIGIEEKFSLERFEVERHGE